jgi:hypothetical protein
MKYRGPAREMLWTGSIFCKIILVYMFFIPIYYKTPWQILFALANLRACLALSYGNKRQLLKSAFEPCFERQRPAFVFN